MKTSVSRWVALVTAALLLLLHLDFWREQRPVIYFDWLPEEIAYRLCWMMLAWAYMLFFCRYVWREDDS